jgi:hypothetical protein
VAQKGANQARSRPSLGDCLRREERHRSEVLNLPTFGRSATGFANYCRTVEELAAQRDEMLIDLIQMRQGAKSPDLGIAAE